MIVPLQQIKRMYKWKCKDHNHFILSEKKPKECPECGCKEINLIVRVFNVETK